ncbi:hypothetical protein [Moraxella lacunata]|uniref:hypothetical protein n=1 Tax=Moraxella lacunata TaxID=477 RepID=UPI003EE02FA4
MWGENGAIFTKRETSMTKDTDNQTGQISSGLYLGFFGLLLGGAYFVIRPFFDWNEGYFAVAETMIGCTFIIAMCVAGNASVIYTYIQAKNKGVSLDIRFVIIALAVFFGTLFMGQFVVKPLYYAIFEKKATTTTNEYYLKRFEQQKRAGVYDYYLYFDDKKCVKINPKTYHTLKIKDNATLTLTYQEKAEILYQLTIHDKAP